ncbi:MAG: DNA repair exonuclease [Planctomycetaceae bacterium]|nr:DNA repair exonuclease [Planctomycetaceae bacterium]
MFRFLHTADLHLDAPFKGLSAYEGAPVELMQNSTRRAFENLIDLALAEKVNFVVIAGDLFDGRWTHIQTGLWTAAQFRRLDTAGIPVYMIRGNHDAASLVPNRVSWPGNVHELPVDKPGSLLIDSLKVAIHGQGFSTREVRDDVAATYPAAVPDHFNIGLLHTSLAGDARHDTYAPTSEQVLCDSGYDYWALGHIHQQQVLRETPCIAYSGCIQGRHILEQGPKGCLLVEVDGHRVTTSFHPVDVVRWAQLSIDISDCEHLDDVYDNVQESLNAAIRQAHGRYLAVRIEITGITVCHQQLMTSAGTEEAINEIRNRGNLLGEMWIEQVKVNTLPPVDVAALREAGDLLGELLRDFESLKEADDVVAYASLTEALAPLAGKVGTELREAEIDLEHPEQLQRWLAQAEGLLLMHFTRDEQASG